MTRTRYGRPAWIDELPKARIPVHGPLRERLTTEVAIVGGGLVGTATAYVLAAAGVPVVLLEAGRLGRQATASGSGLVLPSPIERYRALEHAHGRRAARQIWERTRRAALDLAATVRRLRLKCRFEAGVLDVVTQSAPGARDLKREQEARLLAGLDSVWLKPRDLTRRDRLEAAGGLRVTGGGVLDPFRACLGFAVEAERRGARLFEQTPVRRVRARGKGVELTTSRATIDASTVVIATGMPTPLFRPLQRHFRLSTTYLALTTPLPKPVARQLLDPDLAIVDTDTPPHALRWAEDARLLVCGADQAPVAGRARAQTLVQRTGQLMYELSRMYPAVSGVLPAYGWDCQYGTAFDGVPFVGPHRNYPHHLFALGLGPHDTASAFLASRIVLRQVQQAPDKGDEVFGFERLSGR